MEDGSRGSTPSGQAAKVAKKHEISMTPEQLGHKRAANSFFVEAEGQKHSPNPTRLSEARECPTVLDHHDFWTAEVKQNPLGR